MNNAFFCCIEIFSSSNLPSEKNAMQIRTLCEGQEYSMSSEKRSQFFDPEFLNAAFMTVAQIKDSTAVVKPVAVAFWRCILDEAELDYVFVANDQRGQKLGKDVLGFSHQFLRNKGIVRATLEVSVLNKPAQAIYEDLGYECVGYRKKYYSSGDDARVYAKIL